MRGGTINKANRSYNTGLAAVPAGKSRPHTRLLFSLFMMALILIPHGAAAETVQTQWIALREQALWNNGYERMALDPWDGINVLGNAQNGTDEMGLDVLLIKYNSEGGEEWSRVYDGPAGQLDYAAETLETTTMTIIPAGANNKRTNMPNPNR